MSKLSVHQLLDSARREALLARIERLTELPLLCLSFVMIPLLVGPMLWELTSSQEAIFTALDTFIWAIFAVELGVKVLVAPRRLAYLRRHWLNVLIVAVPFARPFRIVRILIFGSRAFLGARRLTSIDFLLVYMIGLIIIAATFATTFEAGQGGPIDSFPDALWWAMSTVTTVGYGDVVPTTAAGRAIGFLLMLGGIGIFGGLTANLASFFVKGDDQQRADTTQLIGEIARLREEIARLRQERGQP